MVVNNEWWFPMGEKVKKSHLKQIFQAYQVREVSIIENPYS